MDELKPDNVTPIEEGRKAKKRSGGSRPAPEGKIPPAVLYQAVADAINRVNFSRLPEFSKRLVLYSASSGMRVPGEVDDNGVVALYENDVAVESAIMAYVNEQLAGLESYRWTARQVRECRDYWTLATTPITDVAAYRWRSEPGYTFNRLPWDMGTVLDDSMHPTWNGLLKRITNATALCEWIGSLFVPESDMHSYCWLTGQGSDGKGSINRFLARVLGGAYCAKQPPKASDRFWSFGLIGKRLVAFPDCNDTRFVAGGFFKSLTGGDPVDIEAKGKMSFTYRPQAKYFFFSNEKPHISSERADTRRIIYCEFEPNKADAEPGFEDLLWSEGGAFLTNCILSYGQTYPQHTPIRSDDTKLKEHLSVVEESSEVIFEKHFAKSVAPYDTTSGLNRLAWDDVVQRAVEPKRMQSLLRHYFKNDNRAGEFIKWLEIKHCVRKKTLILPDGREPKVYVGIAEKADAWSQ